MSELNDMMSSEKMNAFADKVKNKGGIKVGDFLFLPIGTRQVFSHYHGKSNAVLTEQRLVNVTYVNYGAYSISPYDRNQEWNYLQKRSDFPDLQVFVGENEITDDNQWQSFRLSRDLIILENATNMDMPTDNDYALSFGEYKLYWIFVFESESKDEDKNYLITKQSQNVYAYVDDIVGTFTKKQALEFITNYFSTISKGE
jgi:hypothetical protein